MSNGPMIAVPDMCQKHQWLLVSQTRYSRTDPWRALIIASQIALFQAVTIDPRIQRLLARDIERVGELGCLACQKPDAFGAIVEEAKSRDLGRVKALGERWIAEAAREEKS